jgi:hypothetical protein
MHFCFGRFGDGSFFRNDYRGYEPLLDFQERI